MQIVCTEYPQFRSSLQKLKNVHLWFKVHSLRLPNRSAFALFDIIYSFIVYNNDDMHTILALRPLNKQEFSPP